MHPFLDFLNGISSITPHLSNWYFNIIPQNISSILCYHTSVRNAFYFIPWSHYLIYFTTLVVLYFITPPNQKITFIFWYFWKLYFIFKTVPVAPYFFVSLVILLFHPFSAFLQVSFQNTAFDWICILKHHTNNCII